MADKQEPIDITKHVIFASGIVVGLGLSLFLIGWPSFELGKQIGGIQAIVETMK